MTEWVTVALHSTGWIPTKTVATLFGCYMAGAMWNCCHLSTSSVYTIQPCPSLQCHFIWSHIHRMHVCIAVTCHLHFWQNDWDHLCATVVTWGWNRDQNKESAQKNYHGEDNSPTAPAPTQTQDLWIKSLSLHHWAIPTPQHEHMRCTHNTMQYR